MVCLKFVFYYVLTSVLLGLVPFCIGSNFWKFYLIKTSFTLGEPVYLVKMFTLFRLEWIFFGVKSVDTVARCTTSWLNILSIGRANVFVMPSLCSFYYGVTSVLFVFFHYSLTCVLFDSRMQFNRNILQLGLQLILNTKQYFGVGTDFN
jgi:hypothetical protein